MTQGFPNQSFRYLEIVSPIIGLLDDLNTQSRRRRGLVFLVDRSTTWGDVLVRIRELPRFRQRRHPTHQYSHRTHPDLTPPDRCTLLLAREQLVVAVPITIPPADAYELFPFESSGSKVMIPAVKGSPWRVTFPVTGTGFSVSRPLSVMAARPGSKGRQRRSQWEESGFIMRVFRKAPVRSRE